VRPSTSAQIRPGTAPKPVQGVDASVGEAWLSLSQAAAALGIHPVTLRRWADLERIPASRTAGGHRRFSRLDVETFLKGHRRIRRVGGIEHRWAAEAQRRIRRQPPFDAGRITLLDPIDRERFRRSGQRLLALTVEVCQGACEVEQARREAKRIGRSYGAWARGKGIDSPKMLRAFHLIRRTMIDAAFELTEMENLEPQAVRELLVRLEESMDAVEMGLLEASLPVHVRTAGSG